MVLNTEFKTFFKIKAQCFQSFPLWYPVNEIYWVFIIITTISNEYLDADYILKPGTNESFWWPFTHQTELTWYINV